MEGPALALDGQSYLTSPVGRVVWTWPNIGFTHRRIVGFIRKNKGRVFLL